jgi:hypothetical protein
MKHFDIEDLKDLDGIALQISPSPEEDDEDEDGYYPMLISAD